MKMHMVCREHYLTFLYTLVSSTVRFFHAVLSQTFDE